MVMGEEAGYDEQENKEAAGSFEAEEKQLAKVYRLSGEAKIKGVIEFID